MVLSSDTLPELCKTLVEESDQTERDNQTDYTIRTTPLDPQTDATKTVNLLDDPRRAD